jgi:hypothetical protein
MTAPCHDGADTSREPCWKCVRERAMDAALLTIATGPVNLADAKAIAMRALASPGIHAQRARAIPPGGG